MKSTKQSRVAVKVANSRKWKFAEEITWVKEDNCCLLFSIWETLHARNLYTYVYLDINTYVRTPVLHKHRYIRMYTRTYVHICTR